MSELVDLVVRHMPKALPNDVREWEDPEEQEWFRNCMMSNLDREKAFDLWRRERAAKRLLASLGLYFTTKFIEATNAGDDGEPPTIAEWTQAFSNAENA